MASDTVNQGFAAEGLRNTRQRRAVAAVVEGLESFSSSQEVHQILLAQGAKVGLSTVYRNLQALAEAGAIDSLRNPDGEVLYRKCGGSHHHHLVCRNCGRAVEISLPSVERWSVRAAEEHGFTDVTHTVEIFGLCPECSTERAKAAEG